MRRNRSAFRLCVGSLPLVLVTTTSCTKGTAVGEVQSPATQQEEPVTLHWKSDVDNPAEGKISGTMPDGTHYSGQYFEVVDTLTDAAYAPAWEGWDPYWPDWDVVWVNAPPPPWDYPTFVEIYSGRVIANLVSDDGTERMRCRFSLNVPDEGMAGGGTGDCQDSEGDEITDVLVTAS